LVEEAGKVGSEERKRPEEVVLAYTKSVSYVATFLGCGDGAENGRAYTGVENGMGAAAGDQRCRSEWP
jgi:hypothetical protein